MAASTDSRLVPTFFKTLDAVLALKHAAVRLARNLTNRVAEARAPDTSAHHFPVITDVPPHGGEPRHEPLRAEPPCPGMYVAAETFVVVCERGTATVQIKVSDAFGDEPRIAAILLAARGARRWAIVPQGAVVFIDLAPESTYATFWFNDSV